MPSKSSSAAYQKHQEQRWSAFKEYIEREQKGGNTRLAKALQLFPSMDSYGWRFLDKFQMVGILPTRGEEYEYYSLKGHGVAFLADDSNTPVDQRFVFDSEQQYVRGAAAKAQDAYKAHVADHPIVLFFYGGDDGHVGMRFTARQEALDFLDMLECFEDVFDFDKNPKALHKALYSSDSPEEQKQMLDMTLCYHN